MLCAVRLFVTVSKKRLTSTVVSRKSCFRLRPVFISPSDDTQEKYAGEEMGIAARWTGTFHRDGYVGKAGERFGDGSIWGYGGSRHRRDEQGNVEDHGIFSFDGGL